MREIRVKHPETAEAFALFGFRESCSDCSLEVLARKHGLLAADVVDELNRAVAESRCAV